MYSMNISNQIIRDLSDNLFIILSFNESNISMLYEPVQVRKKAFKGRYEEKEFFCCYQVLFYKVTKKKIEKCLKEK